MDIITLLRVAATVFSFFIFIGICFWAFNRRNKATFDEIANLPVLDEDLPKPTEECKDEERRP